MKPCLKISWRPVEGPAKEWSLGCVIPASWPPLALWSHFTQPRENSSADSCSYQNRSARYMTSLVYAND